VVVVLNLKGAITMAKVENEKIVCWDCEGELPKGAYYELKGEPETPVCAGCCANEGMAIGEPDEACPECDEWNWHEVRTNSYDVPVSDCMDCGYTLDLTEGE
jgi:hypothetical protein